METPSQHHQSGHNIAHRIWGGFFLGGGGWGGRAKAGQRRGIWTPIIFSVQMPDRREINHGQKSANSPSPRNWVLSLKNAHFPSLTIIKHRSVKKRIKHQKVINKRLQSSSFKMQRPFNIKISPDLYYEDYLNLVNNGLTGLTRLLLFRDVTSLWPLEYSSNKDVFERFTFHVGDERWFSQQIGWFSIVLQLYNVTGQTLAS